MTAIGVLVVVMVVSLLLSTVRRPRPAVMPTGEVSDTSPLPMSVHAGLQVESVGMERPGLLRVAMFRPNAPVAFTVRNPTVIALPALTTLQAATLTSADRTIYGGVRLVFTTTQGCAVTVTGSDARWATAAT